MILKKGGEAKKEREGEGQIRKRRGGRKGWGRGREKKGEFASGIMCSLLSFRIAMTVKLGVQWQQTLLILNQPQVSIKMLAVAVSEVTARAH